MLPSLSPAPLPKCGWRCHITYLHKVLFIRTPPMTLFIWLALPGLSHCSQQTRNMNSLQSVMSKLPLYVATLYTEKRELGWGRLGLLLHNGFLPPALSNHRPWALWSQKFTGKLFNRMLKHVMGGIESKEAFLSLVLKIFGSSFLATRSYALVIFMSLLLHRAGVQEMLVQ